MNLLMLGLSMGRLILSLNQDLSSILDVDARLRYLVEFAALQVVDSAIFRPFDHNDACDEVINDIYP